MSKQFWAVVIVIILALVGVFALTGHKSPSSSGSSKQATNHTEGEGKSNVTLVEYGDYQCPYCQVYYSTVKSIQSEYNTQITFQFRNFPLTSIHQNAFAAARAAEAADLQGKFWQMHDILYENNDPNEQSGWVVASDPTTYFDQFAQQIGLNVTKFKQDYASNAVNDRINADMAAGNKLGITGTPSFYLDGKQVQVSNTTAAFEKVINAELAKKAGKATSSTDASAGTTTQSKQ